MNLNCNTALLDAYSPTSDNPWDVKKVQHLYRRVGYGISFQNAKEVVLLDPGDVIDAIIDEAMNMPPIPPPSWSLDQTDLGVDDFGSIIREWRATYLRALFENGLRDRLSFFWSNHLVVEDAAFAQCGYYLYNYTTILQRNALGDYKAFLREMGVSPAMLKYLNGNQNSNSIPNENYARELYELFTLGEGNGYTEDDIIETARALTGYVERQDRCAPYEFKADKFDNGEKTIFGRTGNWGYDDVIDILFEERPNEIATFIIEKIYQYFVHPELPENGIIEGLVATYRNANFHLAPVLRQLFKSEHFFNSDAMDVIIKSPVDLFLSFYADAGITFPEDNDYLIRITDWARLSNQTIFSPPNVAGWRRDRDWISSPTLIARWTYSERIIRDLFRIDEEPFRDMAKAIAEESTDVEEISKKIVDHFIPDSLFSEADYEIALVVFKSDAVPENLFEDGTWNLDFNTVPKQVCLLLGHLIKQPEFQLK